MSNLNRLEAFREAFRAVFTSRVGSAKSLFQRLCDVSAENGRRKAVSRKQFVDVVAEELGLTLHKKEMEFLLSKFGDARGLFQFENFFRMLDVLQPFDFVDPELFFDRLPQPYRMLNKILEEDFIERSWREIVRRNPKAARSQSMEKLLEIALPAREKEEFSGTIRECCDPVFHDVGSTPTAVGQCDPSDGIFVGTEKGDVVNASEGELSFIEVFPGKAVAQIEVCEIDSSELLVGVLCLLGGKTESSEIDARPFSSELQFLKFSRESCSFRRLGEVQSFDTRITDFSLSASNFRESDKAFCSVLLDKSRLARFSIEHQEMNDEERISKIEEEGEEETEEIQEERKEDLFKFYQEELFPDLQFLNHCINSKCGRHLVVFQTNSQRWWHAQLQSSWRSFSCTLPSEIRCVDFNVHANLIAFGLENGCVVVGNISTGRYQAVVRYHTGSISAISILNARTFVCGATDGKIRLFELISDLSRPEEPQSEEDFAFTLMGAFQKGTFENFPHPEEPRLHFVQIHKILDLPLCVATVKNEKNGKRFLVFDIDAAAQVGELKSSVEDKFWPISCKAFIGKAGEIVVVDHDKRSNNISRFPLTKFSRAFFSGARGGSSIEEILTFLRNTEPAERMNASEIRCLLPNTNHEEENNQGIFFLEEDSFSSAKDKLIEFERRRVATRDSRAGAFAQLLTDFKNLSKF